MEAVGLTGLSPAFDHHPGETVVCASGARRLDRRSISAPLALTIIGLVAVYYIFEQVPTGRAR